MNQSKLYLSGSFSVPNDKGYTTFIFMGGRSQLKCDACRNVPYDKMCNVVFSPRITKDNYGNTSFVPNSVLSFEECK
ncbi:MAG: hypothetical protein JXR78_01590 [Victivallales bacterium]|nr:hypothetical protein [Victivallales bacterium]